MNIRVSQLSKSLETLPLITKLQPEHRTYAVADEDCVPFLQEGDYAVVDINLRQPEDGGVYLIQFQGSDRPRYIKSLRTEMMRVGNAKRKTLVWWITTPRGLYQTKDSVNGIPVFAGVSDGPYYQSDLEKKIVGRVVGYTLNSIALAEPKKILAPAAGYRNEEESNLVFEPLEYISALESAGYKFEMVFDRVRNDYLVYETLPTRRNSKAEDRRVFEARTKYCDAPAAGTRVNR